MRDSAGFSIFSPIRAEPAVAQAARLHLAALGDVKAGEPPLEKLVSSAPSLATQIGEFKLCLGMSKP